MMGAALAPAGASPANGQKSAFVQVNLVSNQPNVASLQDPDLVNAWGLAASPGTDSAPGSPLWVSDNGTDKTTLYIGTGPASVAKFQPLPAVSVTGARPASRAIAITRAVVPSVFSLTNRRVMACVRGLCSA